MGHPVARMGRRERGGRLLAPAQPLDLKLPSTSDTDSERIGPSAGAGEMRRHRTEMT